MAKVKVRCIESRQIGDDIYNVTGEYTMDEERAKRYSDWFEVIGKVRRKASATTQNKNAGIIEDK
jgi:hypothetical protein